MHNKGDNMKNTEIKKILTKKNKELEKKEFSIKQVAALLIITIFVTIIVAILIKPNKKYDKYELDILKNYETITEKYYKKADKEKVVSGAIDGMIKALDDSYSRVLNDDTDSTLLKYLRGQYEGIGVQIAQDENNNIVIVNILKDSPAASSDLKYGDIIKKIDDYDLSGKELNTLTKYVTDNNKSSYVLTIERENETKEITVERKLIKLKSVASKLIEKNNKKVGYIYIAVFSQTTAIQFEEALKELESKNIDALIIDVRENTGGYLATAIDIVSNFVDKSHVICQVEVDSIKTKYYSLGNQTKKYKMAIIQNHESASASELLSSSLKEVYKAKVVGVTSYGKGTIQEIMETTAGEKYKLTTKKWLTASGKWLNEKGVKPDYKVELNDKYYEEPTEENDNQLQKALEVVTNDE